MGRKTATHVFLDAFSRHLESLAVSPLTIRNYRADIGQFIRWYELSTGKTFMPHELTPGHINYYKKVAKMAPSSMQRHFSSLRKFVTYLNGEELLDAKKFSFLEKNGGIKADNLKDFVLFLYVEKHSQLTVKQYRIGVNQFLGWLKENNPAALAGKGSGKLVTSINNRIVDAYLSQVSSQFGYSQATVQKRRAAVNKYLDWLEKNGSSTISLLIIFTLVFSTIR